MVKTSGKDIPAAELKAQREGSDLRLNHKKDQSSVLLKKYFDEQATLVFEHASSPSGYVGLQAGAVELEAGAALNSPGLLLPLTSDTAVSGFWSQYGWYAGAGVLGLAGIAAASGGSSDSAPETVTQPAVSLKNDTGNITDGLTNDAELIFSAKGQSIVRTYQLNGGALSTSYTPPTVDGAYTLVVTDTDTQGQSLSTSIMFTLDRTLAPITAQLTHDSGVLNIDRITSNAALSVNTIASDVIRTYSINNSTATTTYTAPTVDGAYTVRITDTDTAGNIASSSIAFTLDTTITTPTIALTADTGVSNNDLITHNAALKFSTVDNGVSRVYRINGVDSSTYVAPTENGDYTVVATDTDLAGNIASSSIAFTVLNSGLAITNTTTALTQAETSANATTVLVSATANRAVTWTLSGADNAQFSIDANGNVRFIGQMDVEAPTDSNRDGVYHFTVNGSDVAGNTTSKAFTVQLTDVTELPTWLSGASTYGTSNQGVQSLLSADAAVDPTDAYSTWHNLSASGQPLINQATQLSYAFQNIDAPTSASITNKIDGQYTDNQKAFIRSVFSHFSSFSGLTFVENTSQDVIGADIRLFSGSAANLGENPSTLGFAFQPYSATQLNYAYEGDFFFVNDSSGVTQLNHSLFESDFGDEKATVAHELGHALGLDHPFYSGVNNFSGFYGFDDTTHTASNYNGVQTGGGYNTPLTDSVMETLMSYRNPNLAPAVVTAEEWAAGIAYIGMDASSNNSEVYLNVDRASTNTPWQPSIYDIAALQHLYGVNLTTRAGDDAYVFNQVSPSFTTIWDGGGHDNITHVGNNSALINLNEGQLSRVGSTPGWSIHAQDPYLNPTEYHITAIELERPENGQVTVDADGLGFSFTANLQPNGYNGDLNLVVYYSDNDTRTLQFKNFGTPATDESSLNLGIAFGVTIEDAFGGSGNDVIIGNLAANHIVGGAGNDTLTGGAAGDIFVFDGVFGNDTLTDFVAGQDVLHLSAAMSSVTSFAAGVLNVTGYGSVSLTGVNILTMGVDYVFV